MSWDELFGGSAGGNRRRGRRAEVLFVNARLQEHRAERMHRVGAVVLLAVVLGGLAWFLLAGSRYAGRALLSANPVFTVRRYDLASNGRIRAEHIREYAALPERANLFALDLERIRADLAAVPRVRTVTVTRRLPATLAVRLTERTALAQVAMSAAPLRLAVDAEGRLLGPTPPGDALPVIEGLPADGLRPGARITDAAAVDALALLDLCDATRLCQYVRVRRIGVASGDRLDVTLAGGEQVAMPRREMETKLRKLAAILKTIRDRRLASDPARVRIDMTTDANFPVTGLDA